MKITIPPVEKSIVSLMCNLKPVSVDPAKLFSFGGIAKIRLQVGLTPSNQDCYVF